MTRDCNTCANHVQGKSIDDAPAMCWSCVSGIDLPAWRPMTGQTFLPGPETLEAIPVPPAPSTAAQFLKKAGYLMGERAKQYDSPQGERSMAQTVEAFNAITKQSLTEAEGWLFMQILKDVRQWQKEDFHRDSAEDGLAYSALKCEALAAQVVSRG